MRLIGQIFLVLGLLALCADRAEAHAFVDHAEPRVGSTVVASPATVKIWFTRKLKPDGSSVQVLDSQGQEVDQRDVKIDPTDATLMSVSLPKLAIGTYKVVWTAVCLDGHTTHASFVFAVRGWP